MSSSPPEKLGWRKKLLNLFKRNQGRPGRPTPTKFDVAATPTVQTDMNRFQVEHTPMSSASSSTSSTMAQCAWLGRPSGIPSSLTRSSNDAVVATTLDEDQHHIEPVPRSSLPLSEMSLEDDSQGFPSAFQSTGLLNETENDTQSIRQFSSAGSSLSAPAEEIRGVPNSNDTSTSTQQRPGILKQTGSALLTALRLLHQSADFLPPLKSAAGGLIAIADLLQATTENYEEYQDLERRLTALAEGLAANLPHLVGAGMTDVVTMTAKSIDREVNYVQLQQKRHVIYQGIEARQDKDDMIRRYRQIVFLFGELQFHIGCSILKINLAQTERALLDHLLPVDDARYNSRYSATVKRGACTPQTRQAILKILLQWVGDPNGARVYWMSGMAGTGKTTILYTLCELLASQRQLGANYFCSRISIQCRDINNVIPTIAFQLAQHSPAFRMELCKVLEKEPEASKLYMPSQLQKLIREPLDRAKYALTQDVVVLVDALDECEDSSTMEVFLRHLLGDAKDLPIKFIVTSRPEPGIRTAMHLSTYSPSILRLHDIEESIVQADIETFLTDALAAISPTLSQIKRLADKAGKLFIFAATAVRYIAPNDSRVDSIGRLQQVLASAPTSIKQHQEIDELYRSILVAACDGGRLEDNEIKLIHSTVHTVICAKEPMSVETLARILGCTNLQIQCALEPLHSLLHVQEGAHWQSLVTPFHASFPDFVYNSHRSGPFFCDNRSHSAILAEGCFNVMEAQLRFNICNLESPFAFDQDVPGLQEMVKNSVSPALSYSSRFWGDHLAESKPLDTLHSQLVDFLSKNLLCWMEVLNLEGRLSVGVGALRRVNQ